MKKLVTKLRKGPVPQVQTPDSPESMQSLFSEAAGGYLPDVQSDEEEEQQVVPQPIKKTRI